MSPLERILVVYRPYEVARALKTQKQKVNYWKKTGRVSAEYCIALEQLMRGSVTRYELRPDVFGEKP